jgi:hypothetical protein
MGTATVVAVLVAVVSLLLLQLLELSDTTAVAASSAGPPGASTPPSVGVAPTSDSGVGALVTHQLFDELYPNRNKSFYTYDAFIAAARAFPTFGTQGSHKTRVREIAAFSAHVQQETAGLFYVEEIDQSANYCDNTSIQYPCAPGQKYFGRGPLQLSW